MAEHILRKPDYIFTEYRKLLEAMSKKPKITTREVGNIKHPNFAMDSACVSWTEAIVKY